MNGIVRVPLILIALIASVSFCLISPPTRAEVAYAKCSAATVTTLKACHRQGEIMRAAGKLADSIDDCYLIPEFKQFPADFPKEKIAAACWTACFAGARKQAFSAKDNLDRYCL